MFFDSCQNMNDRKAEYKKLAMKHHPDMGGDVRTMQATNAEYNKTFALSGCQLSENSVRVVTDWKGGHATVSVENISNDTFKAGEVKVSGDISRSPENGEKVGTIWGTNSNELKPGDKQTIQLKADFDRGTEKDYPNWSYHPTMLKVSILRSGYL